VHGVACRVTPRLFLVVEHREQDDRDRLAHVALPDYRKYFWMFSLLSFAPSVSCAPYTSISAICVHLSGNASYSERCERLFFR
jgi:hypothetical protein